ncbi:MAG: helix-turn-helix transcriptional regulator [Negativicutes bacterium]|nr:helix-turn-helix transcriptional regulator [Negativicutes bacterium]
MKRDMSNGFASQLKKLRDNEGMTLQELGWMTGTSLKKVVRWEAGESEPDIDSLKKISQLFQVTIDDLLDNAIPPKEKAGDDLSSDTVQVSVSVDKRTLRELLGKLGQIAD